MSTLDKTEIKPNKSLEDTDTKYFPKYADKQIGVELPGAYDNKNELRLTR